MNGQGPGIGDEVLFHGRRWTVTKIRPTNEDDWLECRDLSLVHSEGVGQVWLWVDQCAVVRVER